VTPVSLNTYLAFDNNCREVFELAVRRTCHEPIERYGVRAMAANAYILINTEPAATQQVIARIRDIGGTSVREVLGPYDIVVELEAGTPEDIVEILRHRIRPIRGVTNTVTCLWF
jgi:DNA-binding Lrp family transcriptional regulator